MLMDHLESKGAVLIEGAKWCGKTTSAKHIAKSVIEMDRPDMTVQYQQMARIKPSNLLEGEVPHGLIEVKLGGDKLINEGAQSLRNWQPELIQKRCVNRHL